MPGNHCCITNCSSTSHDYNGKLRKNGIQFFRIPKWTTHQGEEVSDLTRRRRIAWLAAIRRKDLTFDRIPQSMRVCSLHFHSGKPSYQMLQNHPDWTPSLQLGHNDIKKTDGVRYQRLINRRTQHLQGPPAQDQQPPPAQDQQPPPLQIGWRSSWDLPWLPPRSEVVKRSGGYISIIVNSEEELMALLENHKRPTFTSFNKWSVKDEEEEKARLVWQVEDYCEDTPLCVTKRVILGCVHGKASKSTPTAEENAVELVSTEKAFHGQNGETVDCPAKLFLRYVKRYDTFSVKGEATKVKKEDAMKRLKEELLQGSPPTSTFIHVKLPLVEAHQNHTIGESCCVRSHIHPKVRDKVYELVGQGITSVALVKRALKRYVLKDLSPKDEQRPYAEDRAYFPTDSNIQSHIHRALVAGSCSALDQENMGRKRNQWEEESQGTLDTSDDEIEEEEFSEADKGEERLGGGAERLGGGAERLGGGAELESFLDDVPQQIKSAQLKLREQLKMLSDESYLCYDLDTLTSTTEALNNIRKLFVSNCKRENGLLLNNDEEMEKVLQAVPVTKKRKRDYGLDQFPASSNKGSAPGLLTEGQNTQTSLSTGDAQSPQIKTWLNVGGAKCLTSPTLLPTYQSQPRAVVYMATTGRRIPSVLSPSLQCSVKSMSEKSEGGDTAPPGVSDVGPEGSCDNHGQGQAGLLPDVAKPDEKYVRHISILQDGATPEINKSSDGEHFKCPFCKYVGMKYMVETHIKGHASVKHKEFTIIKCGLWCRTVTHFHCCYCATTVINRAQFQRHLMSHQEEDHAAARLPDPPARNPDTPAPAQTLGAPAPAQTLGAPAPAQTLGAPAQTLGAPAPAQTLGAPAPAQTLGAPAPAQTLGAPAPAQNLGAPAPAQTLGAPAQNLGAPAPAQTLGAPAQNLGAPAQTLGGPAPAQTLGGPAPAQTLSGPAPAQTPGAPAPAQTPGAPAQTPGGPAPAQTPGAPAPAQTPGAPAQTLGVPAPAWFVCLSLPVCLLKTTKKQ